MTRGTAIHRPRGRPIAVVLAAALLAIGCRHAGGRFVWVDDLPDAVLRGEPEYVIASGDLVAMHVLKHENLSTRAPVRSDGRVTFPLVGDVEAAGTTPRLLAERVQSRMKEFIVTPVVTIAIEQPRPFQVAVAGEVARPGVYAVDPGAGLLTALASAGGLTHFADASRIFVLRPDQAGVQRELLRVRFEYGRLSRADGRAGMFRLRSGDVVVVE